MALPKRRHSNSRTAERRSHLHLDHMNLTVCPQCHVPRLPHRACPGCGYYKGVQAVKVEKAAKER